MSSNAEVEVFAGFVGHCRKYVCVLSRQVTMVIKFAL